MSDRIKKLSDINESVGIAAGVSEGYLTDTLRASATYVGYGSTGVDHVLGSAHRRRSNILNGTKNFRLRSE